MKLKNVKNSLEKTKWVFKIPYILSVKITLLWDGWRIEGRFLFLWFYFCNNVGCDHKIRFDYFPWRYNLIVYNYWMSSLSFGFKKSDCITWKLVRKVKKMTTKERNNFIDKWNLIVSKSIPCLEIKK